MGSAASNKASRAATRAVTLWHRAASRPRPAPSGEVAALLAGRLGGEVGQELQAEPVARHPGVAVGRVVGRCEAGLRHRRVEHRAAQAEQRPHQLDSAEETGLLAERPAGGDAAEAFETAAEENPQQHGLGLVVGVVGGGYRAGAEALRQLPQEGVAGAAGVGLAALLGRPAAADRGAEEGHAEPAGEDGGGGGALAGAGIEAMVEVGGEEREAGLAGKARAPSRRASESGPPENAISRPSPRPAPGSAARKAAAIRAAG